MSSPLAIPTGTITGQVVNGANVAVAGVLVIAKLSAGLSTPQSIAPAGQIVPVEVTAFTDVNGFWQLNLIPNNNINPANTTYVVNVPGMPDVPIQLNDTNSHPYLSLAVGPVGATLQAIAQTIPGALTVQGLLTAAAQIVDSALTTGQVLFPLAGGQLSGDPGLFWDNTNKRLGVGTAAPSQPLHVVGSGLISNGLTISAGGLTLTAGNASFAGHLVSTGPVPTLGSLQTGISSQLMVSNSTDTRGGVQITTTASPPGAGAVVAILNFGGVYSSAPFCVVSSALGTGTFIGSTSTTALTIQANAALAASTTYQIFFVAIG